MATHQQAGHQRCCLVAVPLEKTTAALVGLEAGYKNILYNTIYYVEYNGT